MFSRRVILAAVPAIAAAATFTKAIPAALAADAKGKVLIVLSGAHELQLREGRRYRTGVYLDELAVPLRKMLDAGYEPVFATPGGVAAAVDPNSENLLYFKGDAAARDEQKALLAQTRGIVEPRKLSDIVAEGTSDYVGIFIPGGFAPLQDLVSNAELGAILKTFHDSGRPTGAICHGPVALLSALPDAKAYEAAMIDGDFAKASRLAANWIYAGYRLTVFSSAEELLARPQLGGQVKYYVSDALSQAGAHVDRLAQGAVNVIEDRELITGQQPFSSDAFADAFVAKLNAARAVSNG